MSPRRKGRSITGRIGRMTLKEKEEITTLLGILISDCGNFDGSSPIISVCKTFSIYVYILSFCALFCVCVSGYALCNVYFITEIYVVAFIFHIPFNFQHQQNWIIFMETPTENEIQSNNNIIYYHRQPILHSNEQKKRNFT